MVISHERKLAVTTEVKPLEKHIQFSTESTRLYKYADLYKAFKPKLIKTILKNSVCTSNKT
jgi:hypothetical protein